ncbi:helix-turn-helix domain-containing protein [Mycolicibacterium elephantis]|uniref:Helix-turn-helix domain-containing protein n=1 Tax=Mycolicibacterium elephantis DSM 44368 TaxID=1335622 RepID=A0A439E0M1_9MYCO|nr:helix-turn-helix domain-containing protein [Mycolicibacterium elephantis]MCV7221526.1 helix-turn-helix domain-containing protein [Mycolicibacterium elephantis]RWA23968.1 hypothetical protein MELE44368_01790 [Mycolicibacterium elephantis DSM 44368]
MFDFPALPAQPTIAQAAHHLNCSSTHIRRLIASGQLKARRIGVRAIRIDRESLLKLGQPVGGAR